MRLPLNSRLNSEPCDNPWPIQLTVIDQSVSIRFGTLKISCDRLIYQNPGNIAGSDPRVVFVNGEIPR